MVNAPPPTIATEAEPPGHRRNWIAVLILAVFAAASIAAQVTTRKGETLTVDDTLTDMGFFAASEMLTLSAKSSDDIFAAAGDIKVVGAEADHLVIAGGTVTVTDAVADDIILAGGEVSFTSGRVSDDIVAASGELTIGPEFSVGDSAMLASAEIKVGTTIPGDLYAAGASVTVTGDVGGTARLYAETVEIGPGVTIAGDLRYRAESFVQDPSAVVTGEVIALTDDDPKEEFERMGERATLAAAMFGLAMFAGIVLLIVLSAAAFPGLMGQGAALIRTRPLMSLLVGIAAGAGGPFAIILLLSSVVGIPLAVIMLFFVLTTVPVAIAVTSTFIGDAVRHRARPDAAAGYGARLLWTLGGFAVLLLIGMIPFLGGVVWLMAYLFGFGAMLVRGGQGLAGTRRLDPRPGWSTSGAPVPAL